MKRILLFLIIIGVFFTAAVQEGWWGLSWGGVQQAITRSSSDEQRPSIFNGGVRVVSEESVVIEVVENLQPSVVTVGVIREQPIIEYDPLDPFGFFRAPRQRGTRTEKADIGSGFIISEDGLIVTNKHVVGNPQYSYNIITNDGETYEVTNIYRDPANDIAILQIDAQGLPPVEMGDSDAIKVGQLVVALGTPLGEFRGSVTKGIVSGLGRGITAGSPFQGVAEEIDNVIQTDAAINPGNSGGPLVNSSSQVIGINTAVASGAENIGFALPINLVKEAVKNFEETGSFERAFLGVQYRMIDRELSVMNDIPEGAYVLELVPGSAAEADGVEVGDIITKFNGTRVNEESSLAELINKKKIGDSIQLTVWRDGEEQEVSVTLRKLQEDE